MYYHYSSYSKMMKVATLSASYQGSFKESKYLKRVIVIRLGVRCWCNTPSNEISTRISSGLHTGANRNSFFFFNFVFQPIIIERTLCGITFSGHPTLSEPFKWNHLKWYVIKLMRPKAQEMEQKVLWTKLWYFNEIMNCHLLGGCSCIL